MDWMYILEILISTVAVFAIGALWYTALFGKAWQAEVGLSDAETNANVGRTHGLAFLLIGVCAWAAGRWAGYHNMEEQTFGHGFFHGSISALTYALPAIAIHYTYQKKSIKLFLIDAAYIVLVFGVSGGIQYALKLAAPMTEG